MNQLQYDKYNRMLSSPIDVLIHAKDKKGNYHFLIRGNSKYKVSIYKKSGIISCTCPDYRFHCKSATPPYLCKHCLFILIKYTRYIKHIGNKKTTEVNHPFYKQCIIKEWNTFVSCIDKLGPCNLLK